jgi:hypothetical protein
MRRAAAMFAILLSAVCCSKPPKTTVDVDTMREASFVNDIKEEPKPAATDPPADDSPVPAATGPVAATPTDKGGLPEPEIISKKIDKDDAKDKGAGKPAKKPVGREKITAAECARMFDHFFDLLLESDARFKDLGPDARGMVRQISAQDERLQSLQKDCETDVSRTKHTCAMAAKTPAAWQTCVK